MSSGTTTNPCKCCSHRVPVKLSCRTRAGTGTLCGFSEYYHPITLLPAPSVPPRKYRTQTLGQVAPGGYARCNYLVVGCTGTAPVQQWDSLSGTYKYSATDCSETNTQFDTVKSYNSAPAVCSERGAVNPILSRSLDHTVGVPPDFGLVEINIPHATSFVTQTSYLFDGNGFCNANQGESGNVILLLSDEDTEATAAARSSATWSGWTVTGDGTGGTCLAPTCCLAFIDLRTSGFTFTFQSAQFRVVDFPGTLLPGANYDIHVEIYRRVRGSGLPFVLYETLVFPVTTDGSGDFAQFDGDVPNDPAFDSYSSSAFAVPSP